MKKWMLLLMSVIVAVVVAGAIAGFTLGDASDSRQNDPAGTSNSSGDQPADGWRLVRHGGLVRRLLPLAPSRLAA